MTSSKKAVRNPAYDAFVGADGADLGTRLKDVRDTTLVPGGRARTTWFSRAPGDRRPHPRLSFEWPAAVDPAPGRATFQPNPVPTDGDAVDAALGQARREHAAYLAARDIADADAPGGSEHFHRNSIRTQRIAAFFADARTRIAAWLESGTLEGQRAAALHVARHEAEALAGKIDFDDSDTGTYHSFGHDAPFVHYLEHILESLPDEGGEAMALLPAATRESVRRQQKQARAHLDYLMRNKYAFDVIEEGNVERTLGGFLIDRRTRNIVSIRPDSDPIAPRYELLRIAPNAEHPDAGAWIYRDTDGTLRRQDHSKVEVDAELVRAAPIEVDALTFARAPRDPALRENLRFDWDGNGYVDAGRIDWLSWAGHCDVKAVLEELGVTLKDDPKVTEFRSDTGQTQVYDRSLLLEMVASTIELGSSYQKIDGTGWTSRGIHRFGGSRNDSLPDRLQFTGPAPGRSFRWPRSGRHGSFTVDSIRWGDEQADMATVFYRNLPDVEAVSFTDNPRYLRTVEGDYNIIDVSKARLQATVEVDVVDPETGWLGTESETLVLDLSPNAAAPEGGRFFLGTEVADGTAREIYRVYYEPAANRIVGELERWTREGERWTASPVPERTVTMPMVSPLQCTLSRELKRDNPDQFTALLDIALREGKNICADTDAEAEVWNGVVTRIDVVKQGENRDARTEHWQVGVEARFGSATLDYLVRRNTLGEPTEYCPATTEASREAWPDFLWHDIPDIGAKAFEDGEWMVNEAMWSRGIVEVRPDESVSSGFYVYDDHIKNVFELAFAGLGGYPYTVVHGNKRYGFADEAAWKAAVDTLTTLRAAVEFEDA